MPSALDAIRRRYARSIAARAGVDDPRIVDAFATIERERFLGPGPWQFKVAAGGYMTSDTSDPALLYQDVLVALTPEKGINNGEPSLHAKCIDAASPQPGETVVHIGAGTGYYTAILVILVGERGRVHAYEIEAALAARATSSLSRYPTVTVHSKSAFDEVLPIADVVYVSAGASHVPGEWLDALAVGGRLVMPLTAADGVGVMLLVSRMSEAAYGARVFSPAAFIPCTGVRDEGQARALAEALATCDSGAVRSLRRSGTPDDTAWCIGDGWWLSTASPE